MSDKRISESEQRNQGIGMEILFRIRKGVKFTLGGWSYFLIEYGDHTQGPDERKTELMGHLQTGPARRILKGRTSRKF